MSLRAKLARMQAPPAAVRVGPGAERLAEREGPGAEPLAEREGPGAEPLVEREGPGAEPLVERESSPAAALPSDSVVVAIEGARARAGHVLEVPTSFEAVATPAGVLYRRLVRYGASHP
ncbi:MAG: hypothetical protein MUF34_20840, partial [Polyangiaceae bacterium]|nr:hypothetical protein [Polyangiaceae bacterium]